MDYDEKEEAVIVKINFLQHEIDAITTLPKDADEAVKYISTHIFHSNELYTPEFVKTLQKFYLQHLNEMCENYELFLKIYETLKQT